MISYLIEITPAQLAALVEWTEPNGARILLDEFGDARPGEIVVGQGDSQCYISRDGYITEID